jgi:hypothetical protein
MNYAQDFRWRINNSGSAESLYPRGLMKPNSCSQLTKTLDNQFQWFRGERTIGDVEGSLIISGARGM